MGNGGLTFETYKQDPLEIEKFAYRYDTLEVVDSSDVSSEEMLRREAQNVKGQMKANEYADGLHGYDYYSVGGNCVLEVEAVISHYSQIPKDKWVTAPGQTDVNADMQATFARLRASAPPEYENFDRTACQRKALSVEQKKHMKHQLKDYKEMRANWEQSEQGKTWMTEIARLKAMEEGKLEPQIVISGPTNLHKVTNRIPGVDIDPKLAGKVGLERDLTKMEYLNTDRNLSDSDLPQMSGLYERLVAKYGNTDAYESRVFYDQIRDGSGAIDIHISKNRIALLFKRSLGLGLTPEDVEDIFDDLNAPFEKHLDKSDETAVKAADLRCKQGAIKLKKVYFAQLKRLQATYGTLLTDMHPEDLLRQVPDDFDLQFGLLQDVADFMKDAEGTDIFDTVGNEDDVQFKVLAEYYQSAFHFVIGYLMGEDMRSKGFGFEAKMQYDNADTQFQDSERWRAGIEGPHLEDKESYLKDLQKRAKKGGWSERLFSAFRK